MLHDKIHRRNKLELQDNEVKPLISLKLNKSGLASNLPSRLNGHAFDFSPAPVGRTPLGSRLSYLHFGPDQH